MELLQFLSAHRIPFERDVSLSSKSWIKTGGVCSYWIAPRTREQLAELCRFLYEKKAGFVIVGQTSNIFFHSSFHPHVVVTTVKVNQYEVKDNVINCDCGVPVARLAKCFLSQGYAGFYGLVGLPGTVASAVVNNASCFDCSISSMLISAEVLNSDGSVQTICKEDFCFTHRSSVFKRGGINGVILSVKLYLRKASDIEIEYKKSEEAVAYRKVKQERQAGKTLGSVFSVRVMRKNLRNEIIKIAMRVLPTLLKIEPRFIQKKAILFLYGYRDLDNYCSNRQINTFIWQDEYAEAAFERYKEMMNKVYKDLQLEIEERY